MRCDWTVTNFYRGRAPLNKCEKEANDNSKNIDCSSLVFGPYRHTDSHYRGNRSVNGRLSAIQRFDIEIGDYKYGELTVDAQTDQFVAYANVGKQLVDKQVTLVARNGGASPYYIDIARSTVDNDGRVHWGGTFTAAQFDWIHVHGDGAVFFVRGNY